MSTDETPSGRWTRLWSAWGPAPVRRTPRRRGLEPQRLAVLTDVGVALPAQRAGAVAEAEQDGDVVSLADVVDFGPDRDDVARGFVAQDVARDGIEAAPVPVALPGVPVAAADATRASTATTAPSGSGSGSSTSRTSRGSP